MNFVPLRIRQRDGRWVGVLNSEQGSCELPLPITSDEGLRDRELILGIRPEQIGLSNGSAADLSLLVDIEVVEPTGPDTLVVFALNQVKACCRLAPDQAPRVGRRSTCSSIRASPAVRRPERRTAGPGAACSHARKQGHPAGFQWSGAGAVRYRPALPAGWG